MNNKKIIALAISLCFVVASLAVISETKAAGLPVLSIRPRKPDGLYSSNVTVGTTFNVSLCIDNVTNLWSWKAIISWNASVLSLVSGPTEGSFMGSGTLFVAAAPKPGTIPEVSDTYLANTSISGSGILANMTFNAINTGNATIGISNVVMLQPDPANTHPTIAFTTQNASVTVFPLLSLQSTPTIGPGSVNDVGTKFNVSLQIEDITDLWSWKATISWNASLLSLVSGPTEGSFMGSGTLFAAATPKPGTIPEVSDTYLSDIGISGSGVLANMTFEIIGYSSAPTSVIGISNVVMLQPDPANVHPRIIIPPSLLGNLTWTPPPPAYVIAFEVGITGYKLVFMETMNNSLNFDANIAYVWTFSISEWNGAAWVFEGSWASGGLPYVILPFTPVNLTYVYNIQSIAGWGNWIEISTAFSWVYNGNGYTRWYPTTILNVHPGDIAGAPSVSFPYLGADGVVNILDYSLVCAYWGQYVPNMASLNSDVARCDIVGDGGPINILDIGIVAAEWGSTWTNTPPP